MASNAKSVVLKSLGEAFKFCYCCFYGFHLPFYLWLIVTNHLECDGVVTIVFTFSASVTF